MREHLAAEAVTAFLARACERHGGLETYRATTTLRVRLASLRGAVPLLKGLGRTFPAPEAVDLSPHLGRAVFHDFPRAGQVGIYDAGRVAIGLDPAVRLEGPSHRRTFSGVAKWRTWWPHDAIYFLGYALLHYVSLPFSLLGQELIEARRTKRGVELWYRFAAGGDTHSAIEGFYFDESGLLVRHDYRAEIMGAIFNGAHVGRAHRSFGGLLVATDRTVYVKPWHYPVRWRLPVPILIARVLPRPAI
jgi:hypothetical protein